MDRQAPRSTSNEIDLYIRTYYSLLRSSGDVRVRAFEEAHAFSDSSLHAAARDDAPDVAAFAYSAARLPACMPHVRRIVLGQSFAQFAAAGYDVASWQTVTTRGRRRPARWDGGETLAMFITSATDIDDLVPIVTAYQIEWNKMRRRPPDDVATLRRALDGDEALIQAQACDLSMRLLAGSLLEYRKATQRWWKGIADSYPPDRPVYFVSSNTHALCNLVGGYAREHRDAIFAFARQHNPEGLGDIVSAQLRRSASGRSDGRPGEAELDNLSYYLLRQYINLDPATEAERTCRVQESDAGCGIETLTSPGDLDVHAQLFDLSQLQPERLDPRARVDGLERLRHSNAVIINIDYPLGMAAYHHLTQLAQGIGELRGVYVLGKAATLNAKVGDVMLSTVAYDEHSQNTYLFRNCFAAQDIAPYVDGTVLDNQKALTVRGAFLQNREYMNVFYREGYTVLEMEAGPYLSAIYEMVYPKRHPTDEVVHLSNIMPFDFGLIHYASDTPYSRRHSLLSKSLSYFGVDATYGCAIAILRRILQTELLRC